MVRREKVKHAAKGFFVCAIFGAVLSVILLLVMLWLGVESFFTGYGKHVLWIIPALMGVLGIVWYEQIFKIVDDILTTILN